MNKSPINFLGNAIVGSLLARGGKKKTRRALKKIDKRLSGIEETLKSQTEDNAVPEIEAEVIEEMGPAGDGGDVTMPPDGGVEPVPGAVDALEEDSYATAGDSGLNMIRKVLKKSKK